MYLSLRNQVSCGGRTLHCCEAGWAVTLVDELPKWDNAGNDLKWEPLWVRQLELVLVQCLVLLLF